MLEILYQIFFCLTAIIGFIMIIIGAINFIKEREWAEKVIDKLIFLTYFYGELTLLLKIFSEMIK